MTRKPSISDLSTFSASKSLRASSILPRTWVTTATPSPSTFGRIATRIESIASEKRIASLVVADLNGDGRDEALFVIGQSLVCLGAGSDSTEGRVLWQLALPVQTGPPSVAALGRGGELSILLVGTDGVVYAVR